MCRRYVKKGNEEAKRGSISSRLQNTEGIIKEFYNIQGDRNSILKLKKYLKDPSIYSSSVKIEASTLSYFKEYIETLKE